MHETTKVFNTHGVVVQRMIDKVLLGIVDMVDMVDKVPQGGFY